MMEPEKLITPTMKTKKNELITKLDINAKVRAAAKLAITPLRLTAPDNPLSIGSSLKI